MSEQIPGNPEHDNEYVLDRHLLVSYMNALEVEIELEDIDDLNDIEVLEVVVTLGATHELDTEKLLDHLQIVATIGTRVHIAEVLQAHHIPITFEDVENLPDESLQRTVVWWVKEFGKNYEQIGRECFGDDWEEGKWQ